MAIHEYNEGDHPAKFQGLRVVRKVGGVLHQKYFPFRRNGEYISLSEEQELREKAQRLDKRLFRKQEKFRKERTREAMRNRDHESPRNTGVSGISATFVYERKFRAGREVTYYTPAFVVQGSHNTIPFNGTFRINSARSFDEAWKQAVRFYARNKKIRKWKHLLDRIPNPSIFNKVRERMRKGGHDIPAEKLRIVFACTKQKETS